MLKKTITYDDFNDETVTEDFYFHLTKLEAIEMLELGVGDSGLGLEEHMKLLSSTANTREAYQLFKNLLLATYGVRSVDGKRFTKKDDSGRPLSIDFETHPALAEIVFEMLGNPTEAAQFFEAVLPAKMIAAAKAEQEKNGDKSETVELPTAAPVLEGEQAPQTPKRFEDFTRQELLDMDQSQFEALVGKDPIKMTPQQLQIAYQRKA